MPEILPCAIPDWLEREVDEYFTPLPFTPATILDIGANVGAFTRRAHAMWPTAKIICCEPMPFNVAHLRRNAPADAVIISAAIRSFNGVDDIFIGDSFVTGGFVRFGRQTGRTLLVECVAASTLPSCELVKIDTEGCEVEILQSLPIDGTRAIFVEYHSRADADTIRALLDRNFSLVNQDSGAPVGTFIFLHRSVIS